MKRVFVLQHLHRRSNGEDDVKLIGVYRSSASALAAVERLKVERGFCDQPSLIDALSDDEVSGFYIDECELDKDHWTEGFVTV